MEQHVTAVFSAGIGSSGKFNNGLWVDPLQGFECQGSPSIVSLIYNDYRPVNGEQIGEGIFHLSDFALAQTVFLRVVFANLLAVLQARVVGRYLGKMRFEIFVIGIDLAARGVRYAKVG